ncbi:MAG: hypothetical protein ACJ735_08400 [Actinomycetes bacterium]
MKRLSGDEGNAIVEFSFLAVLLLLPLIYAILIALDIQKSAYAVTAATREAGRVFVAEGAKGSAYDDAFEAARLAMRDQGLDLAPGQLQITCEFPECDTAGGAIHVRIDGDVALPLLPSFGQSTATIAVHGNHDEVVDCFAQAVAAPPPGQTTCG